MLRLTLALVFLALVAENGTMYAHVTQTPLGTLNTVLFEPSPVKLPLFFFVVTVMLAASKRASREPPVLRMRNAVLVNLGALFAWAAFGLGTGGDSRQVPWQIFNMVEMSIFALVLLANLRTEESLVSLGKVILGAALWRATAAIGFYLLVVRNLDWEHIPPYMTTHDDTTLFCTGIVLCLVHALNTRKRKTTVRAVAAIVVILIAIQLNNRRLAWVSLSMALAGVYFVLPFGHLRKRINRILMIAVPILALYTAVGWGRTERVFKPLSALNSIDATKDSSTASREVENDNLVTTSDKGLLIGRGFGHTFDAVNTTYELDGIFDQWKFIPHNSYLGLLAFTGILGFAAIWWPLPVCAFLAARAGRVGTTPLERTMAAVAVAEVIIYVNQAYGDMGLNSQTSLVLVVCAYATAARLAVTSGAWPSPAPKPAPPSPAPSLPAETA